VKNCPKLFFILKKSQNVGEIFFLKNLLINEKLTTLFLFFKQIIIIIEKHGTWDKMFPFHFFEKGLKRSGNLPHKKESTLAPSQVDK
jgi:hypothetical protein